MAEIPLPRMCLGVPIDHRLEPLLGSQPATPDLLLRTGRHAQKIENYGHRLQKHGEKISDNEVRFAKWLAKPETKGGVVIVLLQPAERQRYFSDHQETVKDCDTLNAVDEVCKAVTGCGLEKISCFDAFPFHKIPVRKNTVKYEIELDKAYAIFLEMIQHKEPDVVFCCYRSPHSTKYKHFQCVGIGRIDAYNVSFQGKCYACVNGFHPSYALNYLEDKGELRTLFIMEATQAFRRANGTWRECTWMIDLRNNCASIVKNDIGDQKAEPEWTKHDFQRARFQSYMNLVTLIWKNLTSSSYDNMTNDELYHFVLENRYNTIFSDCLLLLDKTINFEAHRGVRLEEKGFPQLRQKEERDVRNLRRGVEKRCDEFLRSLRAAGALFQVERGGKGLFTSAGLGESLKPLRIFSKQSGFHYSLRKVFFNLVCTLNSAYTYKSGGVYDIDKDQLAQAFELAATHLEWAMAKHVASIRRRASEEVLEITSQLNRVKLDSSPQQAKKADRPGFLHTKMSPTLPSASLQSPPFTPPRRSTQVTTSPFSQATLQSSPPATPRFGARSQIRSPQSSSASQYRSVPICTVCKKTGHSAKNCAKTQCYRCEQPQCNYYQGVKRANPVYFLKRLGNNFGHMSFDCPINPSTPQRRR